MKRSLSLTLAMAGMFSCAGLAFSRAADNHSHEKNAFTPDTIPWGPAPPVVRPGAQFAVLEGDPTASTGDFTIRLKMPDGFRIAPHFHPNRENVTVISGTVNIGTGDKLDPKKTEAVKAGGFFHMPKGMHHFGVMSGETIIQANEIYVFERLSHHLVPHEFEASRIAAHLVLLSAKSTLVGILESSYTNSLDAGRSHKAYLTWYRF